MSEKQDNLQTADQVLARLLECSDVETIAKILNILADIDVYNFDTLSKLPMPMFFNDGWQEIFETILAKIESRPYSE